MSSIEEAIEKSKYILELVDDFDDEGSPPYKKATWDRAVAYVRQELPDSERKIKIYHGPDGGIDILVGLTTLIYVPESEEQRIIKTDIK